VRPQAEPPQKRPDAGAALPRRVAGPIEAAGGAKPAGGSPTNAMSFDVEDYFQVEAFAGTIRRDDWSSIPGRVDRNTRKTVDILAETGTRATFFTLAWVARRYPDLVRRVVAAGHELASHGVAHERVSHQTPQAFRQDVRDSRRRLEDLGGVAVRGYRAPSFSIGEESPWAHEILAEEGYDYSSSLFPIRHDLYGSPRAPRVPFRPGGGCVLEIPMTTVRLLGRNWPCAGGGWFRLFPYPMSRWGLRRVNDGERRPAVFYLHPWELDPEQPRQSAPWKSCARHYLNLARTEGRLRALLRDFAWDRMDVVFAAEIAHA
jgi:polysaccharide deacetylase family protein (PEP-CTERM system associated)